MPGGAGCEKPAILKQQLPQVRSELDGPRKLNRYRQQNDSVDLNTEAKAVLEQIVNADNQLNELTFREAEISQLYKRSPHLPGAD